MEQKNKKKLFKRKNLCAIGTLGFEYLDNEIFHKVVEDT